MVELLDNSSQFFVTLLAGLGAIIFYLRSHKQPYFLLACFFATFSLATLYWTLYMLLFKHTPQIFYVSELGWIASFMFLMTLEHSLSTPEERDFHHPLLWLIPIFCVPQLILYSILGDIFFNLLICGITMATAWYSLRGLLYARRQREEPNKKQYFHIVVLSIITLEYCLWTASCFWVNDTLTNPYFWIDFMQTAVLLILLPATRKAVGV